MNTNSVILLLLAILLLWLAVTDKLSRLIDAYNVAVGNATANTTSGTVPTSAIVSSISGGDPVFHLPSLPALGNNAQVPF